MKKTRVFLVDDHAVVRAGYRQILDGQPDLQVVGEGEDGEMAVKAYGNAGPDVMTMDLSMPGIGGLEAIRRIIQRQPEARILAFSMHEHVFVVEQALRAGANGFLSKSAPPDEILQAVRAVAAGEVYLPPSLAQRLALVKTRGDKSPVAGLSVREFEVFCMIAEGLTIPQIGERIALSTKTIANYVTQIKTKLGVSTSAQIARLAINNGFIRF